MRADASSRETSVGTRAAWSRDGRWLSYTRGTLFGPVNLFVIEIGTGRERQVTHFTRGNEGLTGGATDGCLQWLPDNRHLLVSYLPVARQQAANDLGILDVQTGTIARVTISDSAGFAHARMSATDRGWSRHVFSSSRKCGRSLWDRMPMRAGRPPFA